MNRIYQGRVTHLITEKGEVKVPGCDDPDRNAFLFHHRVYQSAVNYYLLALAAMGKAQTEGVFADLRTRLQEGWDLHGDSGKPEDGMRASLSPYMNLQPAATLEDGMDILLRSVNVEAPTLLKAAQAIAADLGGEASIQKEGRSYLPRLCDPAYSGKFPRDQGIKERNRVRVAIPHWLAEPGITAEALAERLDFFHFANLQEGAPELDADRVQTLVREAVENLQREGLLEADAGGQILQSLHEREIPPRIPAYAGGSINKIALKNRFQAYLIFRNFWPDQRGVDLLKRVFGGPKGPAPTSGETATDNDPLALEGRDPVRVARGERGYVFKAFTSLPSWVACSKPLAWKEFDIAAFKEAITTFNQYQSKTAERQERLQKVRIELRWVENGEAAPSSAKGGAEDEVRLPTFKEDSRIELLQALLREAGVESHGSTPERGVYSRSLRHYRDLRTAWNDILQVNHQRPPEEVQVLLEEATRREQMENPLTFGDPTLFHALCHPVYWPIWRSPDPATRHEQHRRGWADDVIEAYRQFLDLKSKEEHYQEPIRFRPAHPVHSPRLFRFSDVVTKNATLHKEAGTSAYLWIVPKNTGGRLEKTRLLVRYSAPRLLRDGLIGENTSAWLQPLTRALRIPEPPKGNISNSAIVLHLRWVEPKNEWLCYLDFPLSVDPGPIREHIGHLARWGRQFNGTYDRGQVLPASGGGLYWPGMAGAPETPWWENRAVQEAGIHVLGVDLGQRIAAHYALLELRSDDRFSPTAGGKPRQAFTDIGIAGGHTWKAAFLQGGTLRLPGEDTTQLCHGKRVHEQGGSKGRTVTGEDIHTAQGLLRDMGLLDKAETHRNLGDFQHAPALWDFVLRYAGWLRNRVGRAFHTAIDLRDPASRAKAIERLNRFPIPETELPANLETDWEQAATLCLERFEQDRVTFQSVLLRLANQILPLRGRSWDWEPHPAYPGASHHRLVQRPDPPTKGRKIRGQRGLSFARLEQIETLRRLFQALNRMEGWNSEAPHRPTLFELRQSLPECCDEIRRKIENLRKQRVNQTAHSILATALGLRLSSNRDPDPTHTRHGEYETIPGRRPVDFIVVEALGEYGMSQKRGPSENKRLASWAHRAVMAKLRELAEPFGLPILEVNPALTSQIHAFSRAPAFRAEELSPKALRNIVDWQKKRSAEPRGFRDKLIRECLPLFENLKEAGKLRPHHTLLVPRSLGELLLPSVAGQASIHADINAAINIALKAVASPEAVHLRPFLRLERVRNTWGIYGGNKLDKTLSAQAETKVTVSSLAPGRDSVTLRTLPGNSLLSQHGKVVTALGQTGLVPPKILKAELEVVEVDCFKELNRNRLLAWGVPPDFLPAIFHTKPATPTDTHDDFRMD